MFSRRKMWAKLFITVEVPAPEEPVTAIIGCLTDMAFPQLFNLLNEQTLHPAEAPVRPQASRRNIERSLNSGETERPVHPCREFGVIALDPLHLVARIPGSATR